MLKTEHPTKAREAVRSYLSEALGIDPVIQPPSDVRNLPYYLQDAFEFYELNIRDLPVLLAVDRRANTPRIAAVRDQVNQLRDGFHREVFQDARLGQGYGPAKGRQVRYRLGKRRDLRHYLRASR